MLDYPTVRELWDEFRREATPRDATEGELDGWRVAFHAGAFSMLEIVFKVGERGAELPEGDASDAEIIKAMLYLKEELDAFFRALPQGQGGVR